MFRCADISCNGYFVALVSLLYHTGLQGRIRHCTQCIRVAGVKTLPSFSFLAVFFLLQAVQPTPARVPVLAFLSEGSADGVRHDLL